MTEPEEMFTLIGWAIGTGYTLGLVTAWIKHLIKKV